MTSIPVSIKHGGKAQNLELDISQPPLAFKQAIYQVTGVPVDRMKVMVKGGVLKVCKSYSLIQDLSYMCLG